MLRVWSGWSATPRERREVVEPDQRGPERKLRGSLVSHCSDESAPDTDSEEVEIESACTCCCPYQELPLETRCPRPGADQQLQDREREREAEPGELKAVAHLFSPQAPPARPVTVCIFPRRQHRAVSAPRGSSWSNAARRTVKRDPGTANCDPSTSIPVVPEPNR
eukprot:1339553-Rhodomonas_salina.2